MRLYSYTKIVKNNNLHQFLSKYQIPIAIGTSIAMVFGFLAGRAILSLAMFLFFLNAISQLKKVEWSKQKWWILGLSWLGMYALSYFWSTDIPYWQERIQVKFAMIIFPFAMVCLPRFKKKDWIWLSLGINILAIAGCIYSLHFFFLDYENILRDYFKSKVFITPAYKDHIRFSIFIAWVAIWDLYIYRFAVSKWLKYLFILSALFLAIYLHILAVRSGLLMLYSFIFLYIVHLLFFRKKILRGVLICSFSIISIFIIFQTTPSFREKIYYGIYSLKEYKNGNETADYSDIGRLISYKLALLTIKENPIIGVGAGDVREAMKAKYEIYSPNTKPEQRIVPHNQILEVAMVGGLLTLIIFAIWTIYPLVHIRKTLSGFYLFATWFGLLLCLMVEAMLEVQFGVFVYLFAILWFIKAQELEVDFNRDSQSLD